MEIQGYFTQGGLQLSAKLSAGAALEITRVVAGAGRTQLTAAVLSSPCQTLAVNTPSRSENSVTFPVTLAAADAGKAYTLTELGIYARDPGVGEILYKVYRLAEPIEISPNSRLVLRFYLEETVSQDLDVTVVCSPAGLITEKEFAPVRCVVESTAPGSKSVTLDVSELQAYLDALPRLLTEDLTIYVSGSLEETVNVTDFYGSGSLIIRASALGNCTLRSMVVSQCRLPVELLTLCFEEAEDSTAGTALLDVIQCADVQVRVCRFQGNGSNSKAIAICAEKGTSMLVDSIYATGCKTVIAAYNKSTVSVVDCPEDNFSGNQTGIYIWHTGTVLLDTNVPSTLGGAANNSSSGVVMKNGGSL